MALKRYKVVGDPLNSDLIGNSFTNGASNAVFTLGTFNVTTNLSGRKVNDYSKLLGSGSNVNLSLDSLGISTSESILIQETINRKIGLSFDLSDIKSYIRYGSAYELFRVSLSNIILNFPASLFVNSSGNKATTYDNYIYDSATNQASFTIYDNLIVNKFGLIYDIGNLSIPNNNSLRNLNLSYDKYSIYIPSTNSEYQLISFVGISPTKLDVDVVVSGNPFSGTTSGIIDFHIKPQPQYINKFKSILSRFENYVLSNRIYTTNNYGYEFLIKEPSQLEGGDIIYRDKNLVWSCGDGYNVDIDGSKYTSFLNALLTIGTNYDMVATDTIARLLVEDAIIQYDTTENKKITKALRIYGAEFDKNWQYISSLKYINTVTYNKKNNVPDALIKTLSQTYSWPSSTITNVDSLINTYYNPNSETSKTNLTNSQIDNEVWRRILLNTSFFFKSAGTRDSAFALSKIMGIDPKIIEYKEYVYIVENPIIPSQVTDSMITNLKSGFNNLPYDTDGYPKAPLENNDFYFQKSYLTGDTNGRYYMDNFRDVGFKLHEIEDNKKSWVYTGATQRVNNQTNYYANYSQTDSKLVLNTKFVASSVDVATGVEDDVYDWLVTGGTDIIPPDLIPPELLTSGGTIDWTKITFPEFLQLIQIRLINPRNRKVITDNYGGFYPTLQRLYNEYLKAHPNAPSFNTLVNDASQYSNVFGGIIDMLLPSGSMNVNSGIVVRNTIFNKQKFVYRRGVSRNDLLEWLGDDGSEFKSSYTDVLIKATNSGSPCEGGSIQLFVNGSSASQYSWTGPNGFTSILQNPVVTTSATTLNSGMYHVSSIIDPFTTYSASTNVVINTNPIPNISGGDDIYVGDVLSLSGTPDNLVGYIWRKDGIVVGTDSPIYEISGVTSGATGNYELTVVDIHGCIGITNKNVVIIECVNPLPSIIGGDNIYVGDLLSLSGTPSNLAEYIWRKDGIVVGTNSPIYEVSGATSGATGNYELTVIDIHGCIGITSKNIVINLPVSYTNITNVLVDCDIMAIEDVIVNCAPTQFKFTIQTDAPGSSDYNGFELPTEVGYNYDAIVDWGDGTTSTITGATDPNIYHQYSIVGTYQISISGLFESIAQPYGSMYCNNYISLDTPIPPTMGVIKLSEAFNGCFNLTTICDDVFKFCTNVDSFGSTFNSCGSLTTLPNDLFRYNTAVTSFGSTFYNCSSLTTIPENLFYYNNLVTDYSYTLFQCILTLPTTIFNLTNLNIVTSIDYFLYDDFSSNGTIQDIWNYATGATHERTFFDQTLLTNYSSIPNDWKL